MDQFKYNSVVYALSNILGVPQSQVVKMHAFEVIDLLLEKIYTLQSKVELNEVAWEKIFIKDLNEFLEEWGWKGNE